MYVARFRHQPSLRLDAKEDILQPTALTATCGASLPLKLRAEPRMECHCDVEDGSRWTNIGSFFGCRSLHFLIGFTVWLPILPDAFSIFHGREDLVSMVRSAKCLINYFSAHLESTDVSGWRGRSSTWGSDDVMELIPNYLQVISWEENLTSELKMG